MAVVVVVILQQISVSQNKMNKSIGILSNEISKIEKPRVFGIYLDKKQVRKGNIKNTWQNLDKSQPKENYYFSRINSVLMQDFLLKYLDLKYLFSVSLPPPLSLSSSFPFFPLTNSLHTVPHTKLGNIETIDWGS